MNYSQINLVHSLCNDSRTAIFYSTAHTGIIYDYQMKKQQLLQGHVYFNIYSVIQYLVHVLVMIKNGLLQVMLV